MSGPAPTAFDTAFEITVGHEGSFSNEQADPGNWTGGAVGQGQLRGTKYGISAASFPTLDIPNLTLDQARSIYKTSYWDKLCLDTADPGLGLIAFDSSVNNGVGAATKWLQAALGVTADGVFGPLSQKALANCQGDKAQQALTEMHASRIRFMAGLNNWANFSGGWSRRLAALPYQAATMPKLPAA